MFDQGSKRTQEKREISQKLWNESVKQSNHLIVD
jgi:hypothetical protein